MINLRKIKKEFGSYRRIDFFTPDTFLRKITVVSTMFSNTANKGETAVAQIQELNYKTIDLRELKYKTIKKHKSLKKAIMFHEKFINDKVNFGYCEEIYKKK